MTSQQTAWIALVNSWLRQNPGSTFPEADSVCRLLHPAAYAAAFPENAPAMESALANACDRFNADKRAASERLQIARQEWFEGVNAATQHVGTIRRNSIATANSADPDAKAKLDAASAEMAKYSLVPELLKPAQMASLRLGTFDDDGETLAALNSQTRETLPPIGSPDHKQTWAALIRYHGGDEKKIATRHPGLAVECGKSALANSTYAFTVPAFAAPPAPPYATPAAPAAVARTITPDQRRALGLSDGAEPAECGIAADCCSGVLDPAVARAKKGAILQTLAGYWLARNNLPSYLDAERFVITRHPALIPDDYAARNSANR